MRRWLNLLHRLDPRAEDGIALVLALAVLVFASASTATAIYMTTSSQTTSNGGAAGQDATALAKAGLNDALAVLNGQLNSDGSVKTGATSPTSSTLFASPTTIQYPSLNGSVTYSGTINSSYVWTITSTGTVTEQDNTTPVTRTMHQQLDVLGINAGATGSAWSRFYQDSTSTCLTIPDEEFVTNIGTRGNLCLEDGASIGTASGGTAPNVDVGGNITITGISTASNTGTKPPSAATGGSDWLTTNNVYASDSAYATDALNNGSTSSNLDVTGFGLSVPTGATINGITASVQRLSTTCCDAVQTITTSGNPTSGTFTLKGTPPGGSQKTATSSPNLKGATAAQVQTAVQSIYGSTDVTCTGGALPTAIVCTFTGPDANEAVSTMTSTANSPSPSNAKAVVADTTDGGSTNALEDSSVYLLQGGSVPTGETNKYSTSAWTTTKTTKTYGSSTDLWNTTWTPAQVDASNFGVRLGVQNNRGTSAATAEVDYVSIEVYYTTVSVPPGIGTSSSPVNEVNVGGTCSLNGSAGDTTCGSSDDIYSSSTTNMSAAENPALQMPAVDFSYWYQNAEPGPKHFCTNPNPGITTGFFDNNTTLDGSISVNGEMAGEPAGSSSLNEENWTYDTTTPNIDYDCEVWSGGGTSGTLLGEIAWNHTTHVMTIYGTVFIDGSFRFDNDGNIIHYFGRGDLMSSKEDEIDSVVCAGGTGTTPATSCLNDMSSWDPSQNMMVLLSDTGASWNNHDSDRYNEYDQGGTSCSGSPPSCYDGHPAGGFQGILYSTGECMIHQDFEDSGPVICETIDLPQETYNPDYYTFPSIGDLTDGQTYASTASASNFEIQAGQQS